MAELDIIKFDGLTSREWLIYRYPIEKVTLSSTLEIKEGQSAIFVYQRQVTDVFTEGSYVLSTANLPIIDLFENFEYNRKTSFDSKLYFINLKANLDILWGTPDSIQFADPEYFSVFNMRAYGYMNMKISDIPLFLRETIKALGNDAVKYKSVTEFYKKRLNEKLKTVILNIVMNKKISAVEITQRTDEISEAVFKKISPYFENYGLEIVNFFIQSINFSDEDMQRIKKISNAKVKFTSETPIICQKCNTKNKYNSNFCFSCGEPLSYDKIKCLKCGTELDKNERFCHNCGQKQ